jgi:hypothetical protein
MALPRHDRLHVRGRRIEHRCRTIQLSTGDHAASAVSVRQLIQSGASRSRRLVVVSCAAQEWPPKRPELASGALLSRLEHDEMRFELSQQRKCAPALLRVLPGRFPEWLLRDIAPATGCDGGPRS